MLTQNYRLFTFSFSKESQFCVTHHLLLCGQVPEGKPALGGSLFGCSTASGTGTQAGIQSDFNQRQMRGSLLKNSQVSCPLRASSESYFFLTLAVVICCSVFSEATLLHPVDHIIQGMGQSWENYRGTWPEPLGNAFSEVHLTSEFPATQANNFLSI